MNTTLGIGLVLLGFSVITVLLYLKQKKTVAEISGLKEIPMSEAVPGARGIFKGEVGGVSATVPYSDKPVAYYEFELDEEVVIEKDGRKVRRFKRVKDGKSKAPIELSAGGKKLLLNPRDFPMHPLEIHNGRAIGLNSDMLKAMDFIGSGESLFARQDLLTKNLKLHLYGLPVGTPALAIGEVKDEGNGSLTLIPLGGGMSFYPTHDVAMVVGKANRAVTMYLVLSIALVVAGVGAIIAGLVS